MSTATPDCRLLAQRASDFKLLLLAQGALNGWLLQPRAPMASVALELVRRAGATEPHGEALLGFTAPDERNASDAYFLTEVFHLLSQRDGEIRHDLLAGTMNQAVVALWDLLPKPKPDDPEMQFFRHYRNAIAHGDRWHFDGSEPRHPARFRHLEVTRDLEGQRASFDTVAPGLFVQLLDYLVERFDPSQAVPLSDTSQVTRRSARRIDILPREGAISQAIPETPTS